MTTLADEEANFQASFCAKEISQKVAEVTEYGRDAGAVV